MGGYFLRGPLLSKNLISVAPIPFFISLKLSFVIYCFFSLQGCPSGWVTFGDSCFYLNGTEQQVQSDAHKVCQTMGGDLPIIKSAVADKFIFELIKNGNTVTPFGAWLGLERVKVNATKFRWIDDTPLEGEYKNWFDREPNNQGFNEDCVNMFGKSIDNRTSSRAEGKWNDYPCRCHNSLNLCPVVLCQRPLRP